jgi:hypothetical protein
VEVDIGCEAEWGEIVLASAKNTKNFFKSIAFKLFLLVH